MYETFSFSGESVNCYGLEVVKRVLSRSGIETKPFDPYSNNPVLVSLYWPEQLFDFIKWRYRAEMQGRKVIVGGNFPTTSPSAVAPFCDGIFLGDGELWDGRIEGPFMATRGKPRRRAVAKNIMCFPYEDVQTTRRAFVEISRGCKNKCLFCQYGWLKEYREADIVDIAQAIKTCKTKTIRAFAADRFQHSRYQEIRSILDKKGKCDSGSDVSIRFLLDNPEYLKMTNKVRVGVEGLSQRLRRMILKPYSNEDIIRFCLAVADAGIKCLDWYMIYGLPTENESDVPEFLELMAELDARMPAGYVIAIHWNAFTPSAQTPFQWCAPAPHRPAYMDRVFSWGGNSRIKFYSKPKYTSVWTLKRRMLSLRSSPETAQLSFNFAMKESVFKKTPGLVDSLYKKASGVDLLGSWPTEKPLPWDDYCIYQRESMLKCYEVAMKRNE